MSKINIAAYGEVIDDPDLSYELLYDPASNSQDITNGNGRLIIKLKYKIKTLG